MTTPPTDPPRLSDEELDRVYETLSYGSSTVDRDACRAIDQLRTQLAEAREALRVIGAGSVPFTSNNNPHQEMVAELNAVETFARDTLARLTQDNNKESTDE